MTFVLTTGSTLLSTYYLIRFVDKPTTANALYFSITSAFGIDIRIVALIFPIAATLIMLLKVVRKDIAANKGLFYLVIYLLSTSSIVIMLWPWLWENPVERFIFAFNNMSKFRWSGWVLYQGTYFPASALPRHYIPVWLTITTPIIYVFLFVLGVFAIIATTIKNKMKLWSSNEQLQDLVLIGLFFSPIVLILLQKPPLYDGWRHLYFVYPAFIVLVIRGLTVLPKSIFIKKIYLTLISFSLFVTIVTCVFWMVKVHPYQNIYFNSFITDKKPFGYEMDYWGLSDIKALEFIIKKSDLKEIRIFSVGITSVEQAQSLLSLKEQERIKLVQKEEEADFIITNFRFYDPQGPLLFEGTRERSVLVFEIKVDNRVIAAVYERKSN